MPAAPPSVVRVGIRVIGGHGAETKAIGEDTEEVD